MEKKIKSIFNNYYNKGQYLTKFLNKSEIDLLLNNISNDIEHYIWGGYEEASRKRVFLGGNSDVKVVTLKVEPQSKFYKLKHQTVKWYFLNMGISEDMFGDIVEIDDYFVINVCEEIVELLLEEVDVINRVKVQLKVFEDSVVKTEKVISKAFCKTLRIDNVISKTFNMSRNKAQDIIEGEIVLLNDVEVTKLTKLVVEGDVIKIRGKGKIDVKAIMQNDKTKRYIIEFYKYGR